MLRALPWIVAVGLALAVALWVWTPGPPPPAPDARTAPPRAAAQEPSAAPAAAPPLPAPGATDAAEPLAPDAAPDVAFLRGALDAALQEHLDRVKLSPAELDELALAAHTLRSSRAELQALPAGPEHAAERRALLEASAQANATFHRILEMTPGEFTEVVQPEVGVDAYAPDEPVPEPEFIEAPE